ncbi:class B sortase [Clostridium cellulovorans]|uniref:Peptidase C60 sortase A and B n=1 Tax=Clostridium cellulovorans (strain ATCC 35296 / DSM 3052 / OCM 3 / 743B) TaxID=573061 RepID=D9SUH6_CLOC7|nr:class B sortase [Clostridium cellulovorans]ADL52931.1 peptidase C60 sortase A and B [Clostridium cellulovorans 743B]
MRRSITVFLGTIAIVSLIIASTIFIQSQYDKRHLQEIVDGLKVYMNQDYEDERTEVKSQDSQSKYKVIYDKNPDFVGWIKIEDTKIDYPIMQTMEDENYYLNKGFDKEENENGSLILDTDSVIGVGKKESYHIKPSTNLIIHGHNMNSGEMFGKLSFFQEQEYCNTHSIIELDTIYEHREYQICAVFLSKVYKKSEEVFKYYKFFQANSEEEFNDFYTNIKRLSLFDTGVTAEYRDEFITLSTCAYHVEDGRLGVVGKRIQ